MIKSVVSNQVTTTKFCQSAKVWSNHFNLDLNFKQEVFMMQLKTKPNLTKEHSFILPKLIHASKKLLVQILGVNYYLTGEVIYSLQSLAEEDKEVKLESLDGYTLYISQTSEHFTIGELFSSPKKTPEIIRFLNVVLKGFMESKGFKEYGKQSSYFSTETKPFYLDMGITILPGFKINIDKYLDNTIKMNIDTCFRISATHCIFKEFNDFVYESRDKDTAKAKFTSDNIIGKSFCIQNDLNRMVKIHGVDPKKTLNGPSPVEGYPTMRAYCEAKFKTLLKENNQFILYSESKKKINVPDSPNKGKFFIEKTYYPSELLFALGLKDYQKKDFRIMRQVAEFTKMKPAEKMKAILGCSGLMKSICNGSLDMKMSKISQSAVDSCVLSNPEFTIRNQTMKAKDGIIFFKDKIFAKAASLTDWAIIYESSDEYLDNFYNQMEVSMCNLGVPVKDPYCYKLPARSTFKDFAKAIDEVKNEGSKFVLLIINKYSAENTYKKAKEYADLKAQILTQFTICNDKIFSKRGFFDKINYQICSKLGHPLWIVQKPEGLKSSDPETMIIGADVYHSKGKESVTAVVGTLNSDYSKFCSLSSVQEKRGQEIMDNISEMVLECVLEYKAVNKKLPKRILFFRDGVGDTMMDLVNKYELTKIKEGLNQAYPKEVPQITFIVVTKRISEKFFNDAYGTAVNPKSGTIVSSNIIKKEMEFFMIAQNVTEGTATPTRYQILLNECGYSIVTLHEMTFFQAFNYYGWSGAVKVPAVCQYAHKLAYHVGENYRQSNKFMKLNLYYL